MEVEGLELFPTFEVCGSLQSTLVEMEKAVAFQVGIRISVKRTAHFWSTWKGPTSFEIAKMKYIQHVGGSMVQWT